jgi:hypothetical protein
MTEKHNLEPWSLIEADFVNDDFVTGEILILDI